MGRGVINFKPNIALYSTIGGGGQTNYSTIVLLISVLSILCTNNYMSLHINLNDPLF